MFCWVWESDCSNCLLSMSDIKIRSQKNCFKNGFKKRSWGAPLPRPPEIQSEVRPTPSKTFFPDLQKSAPRNQFRTNVQMFIGTRIFKLDAIRLGFYFFFCKGQTLAAAFFVLDFQASKPRPQALSFEFQAPSTILGNCNNKRDVTSWRTCETDTGNCAFAE